MDERTWLEFALTYDHTTDKMEKFEGTPFSGRISGTMARSRDPGVCVCVCIGEEGCMWCAEGLKQVDRSFNLCAFTA